MAGPVRPVRLDPAELAPAIGTIYPEPFRSRIGTREKRALGNPFGLVNFGVNLVRMPPGTQSALRHWHEAQDEFVFVLSGTATLLTNAGETKLPAGSCAGFRGGEADGHVLVNRSGADVVYLEAGDRPWPDAVHYPDDDFVSTKDEAGRFVFAHRDGTPYPGGPVASTTYPRPAPMPRPPAPPAPAGGWPVALRAAEVPGRTAIAYPEPFRSRVGLRTKRALGDAFGLRTYGVNLTTLAPGAMSALRHWHALQDEFVFVLDGAATLITDAGETILPPGTCAGFPKGEANGHHLVNRGAAELHLVEIGDRSQPERVAYPDDDLAGAYDEAARRFRFTRKDGTPC